MFARVNTIFGVRENARVIPEEAIVPQGGKQYVIKLIDGANGQARTSQRVEVKVGLRSPGRVEITEGLEPGDTVVTSGQQRLQRDGTPVTVVEMPGRSGRTAGERAAAGPEIAANGGTRFATGPNPCGILPAGETLGGVPAGKSGRPARSRDSPVPRDPA